MLTLAWLANVSMPLKIASHLADFVLETNCTLSPLLALLSFKLKLSGVSLPANQSSLGVCLLIHPVNYNSFKNANFCHNYHGLQSPPDKEGQAGASRTAERYNSR